MLGSGSELRLGEVARRRDSVYRDKNYLWPFVFIRGEFANVR